MGNVFARIDNRLVHGQVLEAWVPYLKADCILVANDEVAAAPFRRLLMEASVPSRLRVVVGDLADLATRVQAGEFSDSRVLLLFANAQDALAAHRLGLSFGELNLGNMHAGAGKLKLSCTISLAPEDVSSLQSLEAAGVRITSQCIPSDRERPWRKLLPAEGS